MKNLLTCHSLVLLLVVTFLGAEAVRAGYTVVPMQFTLNAGPGETVTRTMTLENTGKEPVSLKISPMDFIKGLHGEETPVEAGTVKRGCGGWIRISPQKLDLAPQETRTVNFSMTLPLNSEGTYWGNILVSQVSKPTLTRTIKKGKASFEIFALQDMLIRVLGNVPGTEQKRGSIIDMVLKDQKARGRATVAVLFENQGNSLLKCAGQMEIRNETGEAIRTIPLEYDRAPFTVYPGGRRIVHGRIKEDLPPGNYLLLVIIGYGGEDLVAGELAFEVKNF